MAHMPRKTERYLTGTGQHLLVHNQEECKGEYCVIHNPSHHALSNALTHWREDRKIMERICEHGVGHPDPDGLVGKPEYYSIHGCCGCCAKKENSCEASHDS